MGINKDVKIAFCFGILGLFRAPQTFNCDVGCWSAKETIVLKQTPKTQINCTKSICETQKPNQFQFFKYDQNLSRQLRNLHCPTIFKHVPIGCLNRLLDSLTDKNELTSHLHPWSRMCLKSLFQI